MQRSEPPNQIYRLNSDDRAISDHLAEYSQRDAVVWIIERRD